MPDAPDTLSALLADSIRLAELSKSTPIKCLCSSCGGRVLWIDAKAWIDHELQRSINRHPSTQEDQ